MTLKAISILGILGSMLGMVAVMIIACRPKR